MSICDAVSRLTSLDLLNQIRTSSKDFISLLNILTERSFLNPRRVWNYSHPSIWVG